MHYSEPTTPFGQPHTLAKVPNLVSAKTYDKAYTPKKTIAVGQAAAAVFGGAKHAGIIKKIGKKTKRSKQTYVWFEDLDNKPVLATNCVGLPAQNEFVRHTHSGRWFKVGEVLAPTVSLFAVYIKTATEKTADAATDKTKTAVAAADKTKTADAATDKTKTVDTATDKTKTADAATDKTKTTADAATDKTKTADAATDETKTADAAADKTKTAVAAADKTKTADAATDKTGREILQNAMNVVDPVAAAAIREEKKKKKAKKKPTPAQGTPKKQVVSFCARFLSSSHTTLLRTIP